MDLETSNFDGDWNEKCSFCGQPHSEHQQRHELPDGGAYLHRMPCKQEQYFISKKFVWQAITLRTVLFIYKSCIYIWDKIPFKDEAKLLWQLITHIFISIRALIYLALRKPK